MIRKASERVRPPVGRASVIPAGARMSPGCPGHSPPPGRFTGTQLRALQRRVKDWRDIMAKRLVYAASDEHAVEQRFREGSVWS